MGGQPPVRERWSVGPLPLSQTSEPTALLRIPLDVPENCMMVVSLDLWARFDPPAALQAISPVLCMLLDGETERAWESCETQPGFAELVSSATLLIPTGRHEIEIQAVSQSLDAHSVRLVTDCKTRRLFLPDPE